MLERHHIEETINNMINDINYIKLSVYSNKKSMRDNECKNYV